VQIAKIGMPATALVEVPRPGGFSYGTAFCIHPSGFFLTNNHVTEPAQGEITLVLDCGLKTEKSYRARVVRSDREEDLALLRAEGAGSLPTLAFGSEESLEVLMDVVAFGFPFGDLLVPARKSHPAISVNAGSVTSLRRKEGKLALIQFDVVVNQGNSGGPLLDRNGKVIGVVVAGITLRGGARTGVNFGIPVSTVTHFLARPDFHFEPPTLEPANILKPVRLEARLEPFFPPKTPYTVDLILNSSEGIERKERMQAEQGNKYQITTVPFTSSLGHLGVSLLARFGNSLLSATTAHRTCKVGGQNLRLREIRSLQIGAKTRAILQDGRTIEGALSGLDHVAIRQGERARFVNLLGASEIEFSPATEKDILSYTVVVNQGGEAILRQTGKLLVQGLLPSSVGLGSPAISPPLLERDKAVRKLPSKITNVVVGGAGRYLILDLRALHHLAVFDVNAAAVVGYIPLREDDGQVAASLDCVIVLLPHARIIERWDLKTLLPQSVSELPCGGTVRTIAMGSASKGPLLVHWGRDAREPGFFSLIDVEKRQIIGDEIPNTFLPPVHIRASANGKLFGLWDVSSMGTMLVRDHGPPIEWGRSRVDGGTLRVDAGFACPGPDGKTLFTERGKIAPEKLTTGGEPLSGGAALPACQGDYYLVLASPATLRLLGKEQSVGIFPGLDLPPLPHESENWIKHDFTFDKRIHLIPDAQLIVTIPSSNDQLVLRRLDSALFEAHVGEVFHLDWKDDQRGAASPSWTRFTPDGSAFAAGGDTGPRGVVGLWDVATGKLLQQFVPAGTPGHSEGLFLSDGRRLLTWYSRESNLFLWEVATGKLLRRIAGPVANPLSVAVSADGKRLLAGGNNNVLYLYDFEKGKELARLQGHDDPCSGVFSPDGSQILTYSTDKTLRLWDGVSGRPLHKLEAHTGSCKGIYSPDGKHVLSFGSDKTVRMWDTTTGKQIRSFDGATDEVTSASWLPDGQRIVAWGKDRKLRIWNAVKGNVLHEWELGGQLGETPNAVLSSEGRRLFLSNYGKSVHLFDLATGTFREVQRYKNATKAQGFSISPDGRYAAAGSFQAGVYVWQLPVSSSRQQTVLPQ
jgi:WD40 repeat protein